MIKVVFDRGRYCPQVFCDHCEQRIETYKDGNAEWRDDEPGLKFTHKRCCYAFEAEHGGRAIWMTYNLEDFVLYLANNVEFGPTEQRQRIKRLRECGL